MLVLPKSVRENLKTETVFHDPFNNLDNWYQDDFTKDDLHRSGAKFLELDGTVNRALEGQKVPMRHAAMMNKHRDKVQYIENGTLVMRPYVTTERNIYRDDYVGKDGVLRPMSQYTPYAAWLSSGARKYSNKHGRQITDFDNTHFTFGRGSIVQVKVNVSAMCMGGVRFSAWPMPLHEPGVLDTPENPAISVANQCYNDDPSIMEIDMGEIENPKKHDSNFGNNLFSKCIGGLAGDTPQAKKNVLKHFNIDLKKGWHTLTLVWNLNGTLDFYCNGILINHEPRRLDFEAYLILSCEICSGLKYANNAQPHEDVEQGPRIPENAGLSARCWIDDLDLVNQHKTYVDYVTVDEIIETAGSETFTPPVLSKIHSTSTSLESLSVNDQVSMLIALYRLKVIKLNQLRDRYNKLSEKYTTYKATGNVFDLSDLAEIELSDDVRKKLTDILNQES